MVSPGTHINAVGADAPGKQELDSAILAASMVVVDDEGQAALAGEVNLPISRGQFSVERIHATLGAVIAGQKPGRAARETITVFDSTGLAIEDIAVARMVFEMAAASGGCRSINFMDGGACGAVTGGPGSRPYARRFRTAMAH